MPNENIDLLQNAGSYVPTTNVWDVSEIYELNDIDEDFRELLIRLYQNLNLIAEVLNSKTTGYYLLDQFVTSNVYYNPNSNNIQDLRQGFRKTINTGALAAGINNVAHNIPIAANWTLFFINGAAVTGVTNWYPLPFAGAAGNNIEVTVTAANIVINNQSGLVFTDSNVILEYVKV